MDASIRGCSGYGRTFVAQAGTADAAHELSGRVKALEARIDYLATKEDISEVKTLIADRETRMLRWLVGTLGAAALGMTASVVATIVRALA